MDITTIIVALIANVGTIIGLYLKLRIDKKHDIEANDAKQEVFNNDIKKEISTVKDELGIITPYFQKQVFKETLVTALNNESRTIIETHQKGLDEEIITILKRGRDNIISVSKNLFFNRSSLKRTYIEEEVNFVFNQIKALVSILVPEYRDYKCTRIRFAEFIEETSALERINYVLIDRILNNNKNTDEYVQMYKEYLKDVYIETIDGYNKFCKLSISSDQSDFNKI